MSEMNDAAFGVLSFGFWVSLLCASLAVAGWIGDSIQRRHQRNQPGRYDSDLENMIAADREKERLDKAA